MRIDPAGWPFIGIGLGVAALVAVLAGSAWGIAALVLPAFFVFFFRDPGATCKPRPTTWSRRPTAA